MCCGCSNCGPAILFSFFLVLYEKHRNLHTKFFDISLLIFDLFFIIYLHIITETVDLLFYIRVQNVLSTVKFTVRGFWFLVFLDLQSVETKSDGVAVD